MNLIELIILLAQQNKYPILFLIYLFEGPNAGLISAIIASTGELNIFTVFILLIIAEIAADLFYYFIGKSLSEGKLEKKLSKYDRNEFLTSIEDLLDRHPLRALIFVKTIGIIAVPTLILIGKFKSLTSKKFILWTSLICFIKDLIIVSLGYTLGLSIDNILDGYDIYRFVGIVISILALIYVLFRINQKKIEEITIKALKKI